MRLKINEIPIPPGANHPPPKSSVLPNHEFTMGVIAPKGQGKTTLLINFILFYRNYFNQIIILSPTIKNDPKWDYLKEQEVLVENKELKKLLKKLKENAHANDKVVQDRPIQLTDEDRIQHNEIIEQSFSKKIPDHCLLSEYTPETLNSLLKQQQQVIDLLYKLGFNKYIADRLLLVCDDMVGSELFSNARDNIFKTMNANHRHYSLSILMVTQAFVFI